MASYHLLSSESLAPWASAWNENRSNDPGVQPGADGMLPHAVFDGGDAADERLVVGAIDINISAGQRGNFCRKLSAEKGRVSGLS